MHTDAEMADMHLAYGAANRSARRAVRLYEASYPARNIPCRSTTQDIDKR